MSNQKGKRHARGDQGRAILMVFVLVPSPVGSLLAGCTSRAYHIHSENMAVVGHWTSYRVGPSSFQFGAGIGPSLLNAQVGGGVAYMQATIGELQPPQIWMRCMGSPRHWS